MKQKIFRASLVLLSLLIAGLNTGSAIALTQNQINVLNEGIDYFNTEDNTCSATDSSSLSGNDNIQKAFNYFISKGLTTQQSAGIIGNLKQESGVNPLAVEANNGPGRGIAQWNVGDRWDTTKGDNLKDYASKSGGTVDDLATQLNFMWEEMSNISPWNKSLPALKATSTVEEATRSFEQTYEIADPQKAQMQNRIDYANQVYQQYGNSSSISTSGSTSACATKCTNSNNVATSSLSPVRQNVVCVAEQELAAWTPWPPIPRRLFYKYVDGQINDQWCGDFASWVYKQAGYPFEGPNARDGWVIGTVTDIMDMGKMEHKFHWHPSAGYTPRPGDLAIHKAYAANGKETYSHVNIVISYDGNTVTLIGGDQGSGLGKNEVFGTANSTSVVSQVTDKGSTGDSTIGYVSPD